LIYDKESSFMDSPGLTSFARRPGVVAAALLIIAILAFVGVNHLVARFREQQKALARRMFRRAEAEVPPGTASRPWTVLA
jgi:hypothetical protein